MEGKKKSLQYRSSYELNKRASTCNVKVIFIYFSLFSMSARVIDIGRGCCHTFTSLIANDVFVHTTIFLRFFFTSNWSVVVVVNFSFPSQFNQIHFIFSFVVAKKKVLAFRRTAMATLSSLCLITKVKFAAQYYFFNHFSSPLHGRKQQQQQKWKFVAFSKQQKSGESIICFRSRARCMQRRKLSNWTS